MNRTLVPGLLMRNVKGMMTLTLLAFMLVARPGVGRASDAEDAIREGKYRAIWHTDEVEFTISKVHESGGFEGFVHFAKTSRYPGTSFAYTAELGKGGGILIVRDIKDVPQRVQCGAPKRVGKDLVWEGKVIGLKEDGNDGKLFELRIHLK